ncbi:hypothetical protein BC943DRAFT_317149 [Umbelopsis sp. AD052]|nr:hypothetical protein BC943DRAFT_317149 [Umbelopsis sp. AD052]
MLNDLLVALLEELALEGSKGASLSRLWSLVGSIISKNTAAKFSRHLGKDIEPTVDESYQRFLWPYIVSYPGIEFGVVIANDNPTLLKMEPEEYKEYEAASLRNDLRLTAKAQLRIRMLLAPLPVGSTVKDSLYSILEMIGFSRENGITQADLGIALGLDGRTVFSITKRLVDYDLIIKKPAVSKGNYTALCLLKRFEKSKSDTRYEPVTELEKGTENGHIMTSKSDSESLDDSVSYRSDVVTAKIIQLLQNKNDRTMTLQDLTDKLGFSHTNVKSKRWFMRYISKLCDEEVLEKVNSPNQSESVPPRSVHLLKTDHQENRPVANPNIIVIEKGVPTGEIEDVPLPYQIYKHIEASGVHGITSNDLQDLMPTAPAPILSTTLSSLHKGSAPLTMKKFSCFSVIERQGREQRHRFYTAANWKEIRNDQANANNFDDGAVSQDELVAEEINELFNTKQAHEDLHIKRKIGDDHQPAKSTDELSDIPLKRAKKSKAKPIASTKTQKKSRNIKKKTADDDTQVFDEVKFGYGDDNGMIQSTQDPLEPVLSNNANASHEPAPEKNEINGVDNQILVKHSQVQQTTVSPQKGVHQHTTATTNGIVTTTPKKKPSRSKCSKPLAQNVTLERRLDILLNILNSDKVREVDYTLVDDFSKEDAIGQDVQYTVDRRTLTKMAQRLEKEGKARIIKVSIPLLNGMVVNKSLLLHGSVNQSDDVVSRFIEGIREQNALVGRSRPMEPTKSSLETEERGSSDNGSTQVIDQESNDTSSQTSEVMASRKNAVKQRPNGPTHWRITAKYYGWIPAIMLRLRMLHRHMMKMAIQQWSQQKGSEEKRPCKIVIAKIITKMPLKLFLNVIGVHKRIPKLDVFLMAEGNSEIVIDDLPDGLRSQLFEGHYRFRRYLRVSLVTLSLLKLVNYTESKGKGNRSSPDCELLTVVPLCDYREVGHPIVRHMKMTTLSNQTEYWKELQFLNTGTTHSNFRSKTSSRPHADSQDTQKKTYVPMALSSITSVSSWFMKFDLDSHSREVLERHVDRENKKTPLQNHRLCLQIANECNISVQTVRDYFRSIESANKRSERQRKEKVAKALGTDARSVTVRKLLDTAVPQNEATFKPHVITTGIQGWAHNRGKAKRYSKAVEKVFEGEDSVNLEDLAKYAKSYTSWTPQEVELLIYSYSILRYRSRYVKFLWGAMSRVLPNRTPEICRHQMAKLLKRDGQKEAIDKLVELWGTTYEQYVGNGTLVDDNPFEMIDFDLAGQLHIFLQELQRREDAKYTFQLPANIEDIPAALDSQDLAMNVKRIKTISDFADKIISMHDRQRLLFKNPLNVAIGPKKQLVRTGNDLDPVSMKARQYIMMILMTPSDHYDPALAYRVLNSFPTTVVSKSIQDLHQAGLIVKTKPSTGVSIPGRGFGVSEKFLLLLTTHLVDFEKMRLFSDEVHVPSVVSPLISNAGMMVLLDAIADKRMELFVGSISSERYDRYLGKYSRPGNGPLHVEVAVNRYTKLPRVPRIKDTEKGAMKIHALPFDLHSQRVQDLVEAYKNPLMLEVCQIINSAKGLGIQTFELKSKLLANGVAATDEQIRTVLQIIVSEAPPLAYMGGYNTPVVISTAFLDDLAVVIEARSTVRRTEEHHQLAKRHKTEHHAFQGTPVKPRLWTDIHGNKVNLVLRGCTQAILSTITRRPGVSETAIYEKFSLILGFVEVKEVLDYLETRKAVRSISTIIPQPVHLFSAPSVYRKIGKSDISS